MTYHTEYRADKGLIALTQEGEIRYVDVIEVAPEVAQLMEKHHTNLALIDLRAAALHISVPELYFVTKRLPELGVLPGSRLAFVCPRSESHLELYDFYALASRNRGYRTKLFETEEEAEAWLSETAGQDTHSLPA
jgi:hypothetical protein